MAVRTPKSAPSGNPPRSGSAATLRTEKASGTYARRLSMVWTYRNDPRCHWLRSRRPQGIGTESVYAACLLYLFLATISRLTPPYLRNPTAEAGLVRSLRQGGFFWGGAPICKRGSAANAPAAGRVQRLGKPTECKARYGCLVFLRPESRLQIRTRLRRFCASSCRPAQSGGRSARRCIRCNPCCCTPRPPPCIRHGWQAAALEAGRAG